MLRADALFLELVQRQALQRPQERHLADVAEHVLEVPGRVLLEDGSVDADAASGHDVVDRVAERVAVQDGVVLHAWHVARELPQADAVRDVVGVQEDLRTFRAVVHRLLPLAEGHELRDEVAQEEFFFREVRVVLGEHLEVVDRQVEALEEVRATDVEALFEPPLLRSFAFLAGCMRVVLEELLHLPEDEPEESGGLGLAPVLRVGLCVDAEVVYSLKDSPGERCNDLVILVPQLLGSIRPL